MSSLVDAMRRPRSVFVLAALFTLSIVASIYLSHGHESNRPVEDVSFESMGKDLDSFLGEVKHETDFSNLLSGKTYAQRQIKALIHGEQRTSSKANEKKVLDIQQSFSSPRGSKGATQVLRLKPSAVPGKETDDVLDSAKSMHAGVDVSSVKSAAKDILTHVIDSEKNYAGAVKPDDVLDSAKSMHAAVDVSSVKSAAKDILTHVIDSAEKNYAGVVKTNAQQQGADASKHEVTSAEATPLAAAEWLDKRAQEDLRKARTQESEREEIRNLGGPQIVYEASKKLRVRARAGVRAAGLERAARVPATAAALLRAKRAKQARLARAMRSDEGASKELAKYFASAHSTLSQPPSAQPFAKERVWTLATEKADMNNYFDHLQQRTETHVKEITHLHHLVEPSSEWQDGLEGTEFSQKDLCKSEDPVAFLRKRKRAGRVVAVAGSLLSAATQDLDRWSAAHPLHTHLKDRE